jgi:radical SAM protein (TIGR01212 family)
MENRYNDYNTYLRNRFGCRVQKISLDAGLTCPNRDGTRGTGGCIYCNQAGSGTGAARRGLSITRQIEDGMTFLSRRYKARKFIAYFQSYSNTYASLETLKKLYGQALAFPEVVGLSIGTRPDCVSNEVFDYLSEVASTRLVWLEVGLQSAHNQTLERIHRGHTVQCFLNAAAAARDRGISVCAHVILGLPGETSDMMNHTADVIANSGIHGVKIHLLYVIRNTALEEMYRRGEYTCLTREEYIQRVCDFLERLPPEMVVQRLTGDPHPEELVAPDWALEKTKNLQLIRQFLDQRDTWQGKVWKSRRGPGSRTE